MISNVLSSASHSVAFEPVLSSGSRTRDDSFRNAACKGCVARVGRVVKPSLAVSHAPAWNLRGAASSSRLGSSDP